MAAGSSLMLNGFQIQLLVSLHVRIFIAAVELLVEAVGQRESAVEVFLRNTGRLLGILQAVRRATDRSRGVLRAEESAAGVFRRGVDRHVTRDLRIVAAPELHHPGTERGVLHRTTHVVAGVHDVGALLVGALARGHRVDHADLVHHVRSLRQPLADHDVGGFRRDGLRRSHHFLLLLRVEGVQMAHAAGHVEVDHALRLRRRRGGRCGAGDARTKHREQVHAEIHLGGVRDEPAPGRLVVAVEIR